jgi:hypothetical protein
MRGNRARAAAHTAFFDHCPSSLMRSIPFNVRALFVIVPPTNSEIGGYCEVTTCISEASGHDDRAGLEIAVDFGGAFEEEAADESAGRRVEFVG